MLGRGEQQPVFGGLRQEAAGHEAGLVASLPAEGLHLPAVEGFHRGSGEILGLKQAGIALGVVAHLEQQHHRAALQLERVDPFLVAARVEEKHVHRHGIRRWGEGPSVCHRSRASSRRRR